MEENIYKYIPLFEVMKKEGKEGVNVISQKNLKRIVLYNNFTLLFGRRVTLKW